MLRPRIIPLLEIVERREKKIEGHLETALRNLAESVKGYPRCFLDVREIEPDRAAAAVAAFGRAAAAGIAFTPVTGVSRTVDVEAALHHQDHGLAIRLTRTQLEEGNLNVKIDAFLETHRVAANEIDIVVDLGAVENMIRLCLTGDSSTNTGMEWAGSVEARVPTRAPLVDGASYAGSRRDCTVTLPVCRLPSATTVEASSG